MTWQGGKRLLFRGNGRRRIWASMLQSANLKTMRILRLSALFTFVLLVSSVAFAQTKQLTAAEELAPGSPHLIAPEELLKVLQSPQGEKPLILNVGPFLLYRQAHIADAEYVGPGSDKQTLQQLRTKVKSLPRDKYIVLYCGCCPWSHCPNVQPAFKELSAMGFTNVKVLYIADNFGTDWVYKGYPTIKGQ
jgi:thiosulfate/3-mercaptopyruvate sulfurtransferase